MEAHVIHMFQHFKIGPNQVLLHGSVYSFEEQFDTVEREAFRGELARWESARLVERTREFIRLLPEGYRQVTGAGK